MNNPHEPAAPVITHSGESHGLTKREYLAATICAGLSAADFTEKKTLTDIAIISVAQADALIKILGYRDSEATSEAL